MASRIGILSRWLVAAFLLCAGTAAHAEKRVALVIGNSAYRTVPTLPNAAADAKLMSDTLLSLGFFVVGGGAQLDLDKARLRRRAARIRQQFTGADVALFYYAGHGVETHGLNYLVPVDAHPPTKATFSCRWSACPPCSTSWKNPAPKSIWSCSTPAATIRSAIAACGRPPAAWRRCRRRRAR